MGGVADDSGSVVLESPLGAGTFCALQWSDDGQLRVRSDAAAREGGAGEVVVSLDALQPGGMPLGYDAAQARLTAGDRAVVVESPWRRRRRMGIGEREYRVGLVGCGQVAEGFHIPAVTRHPRTRLAAVADIDPARAEAYARRFNVPAHYASHGEMLAREALDLAIVATPPAVTPAIAADCLRAGAHVLCEKPIATNREEGRALVRAVEETGRLLQIGFIYRHSRALQIIQDWVRAGRIGSPMVVRLGNWDEPWMEDVPEHNARILGFLERGSPVVMMGAHHADMLTMLVPACPVQAQGVAAQTRPGLPRANHCLGLLRFDDGSVAKIEVGWLHPFPREERSHYLYPTPKTDDVDFFGPRGVASYDFHGGRVTLLAEEGREEHEVPPQELNFDAQWAAFVAAIDAGRAPEPSVQDGYRSLTVTLALQEAIENGEIRAIPLE